MKKLTMTIVAAVAAFWLMGAAAAVHAADAPAPAQMLPIAVVDMTRIMQVSEAAKNIQSQLETKRKEYQEKIAVQENTLRSAEQELIKQKSSLSEEEFGKKRTEFEGKIVVAQKQVQEHKRSLEFGFNGGVGKIQNEVASIVGDIAKERKFMMVLSNDAVVLAERSLDITDEVIKKLNDKLKKVPLDWNAPSVDGDKKK